MPHIETQEVQRIAAAQKEQRRRESLAHAMQAMRPSVDHTTAK